MLDTVLAREPTARVPQLAWTDEINEPLGLEVLIDKHSHTGQSSQGREVKGVACSRKLMS